MLSGLRAHVESRHVSVPSNGVRYAHDPALNLESRYPGDIHGALRNRQIVGALQVDPEVRAVAEQLAEADCHLGGDGLLLVEDVVQRLPGYLQGIRHCGLAHGKCGKNVLSEYLARMDRLNGRVSVSHQW